MNANDLKKYCDDPANGRYKLTAPWSEGDYTYASNGHILVRVPRIDDPAINERKGVKICGTPLGEYFDKVPEKWYPIPEVHPKEQDCPDCNGKGKFKYKGETVQCEECDGKGRFDRHISDDVGGVLFSDVYLSWIAALPNPSIGPFGATDVARFKFDGGEGLLMPRRS